MGCSKRRTRPQSGVEQASTSGDGIMKVASLFLCSFTAISGFAILSLPVVAAECWMTCPPGSASTPSAAEQQPPTAAAEPAALPDQQKPITKANVTDKVRLRRHPQRRRQRRLQPKPPPSHRIHRKRSQCPLKNPLQFKLRKLQRPRLRLLNPQRQPQHRGRMRASNSRPSRLPHSNQCRLRKRLRRPLQFRARYQARRRCA